MIPNIAINTKILPELDIKIEPFNVSKRYTKPHRHNKYIELVYFSEGSGYHYMDHIKYEIKPPIIFVIKKDQVHHWHIDSVPNGYVIIIKESFLEKTLDRHINNQLLQLGTNTAFSLAHDPSLDGLFEMVSTLLKEKQGDHHIIVEGILKSLLAKILHHAPSGDQFERNTAFQFKQLLMENPKNDVGQYAKSLHTTSQNLNAQCKKEFGKTASQVIAQYIIQEAKRQLIYTDFSVSEIAYASNFKDVSHFIKYFKRFEGVTPLQFKKREGWKSTTLFSKVPYSCTGDY